MNLRAKPIHCLKEQMNAWRQCKKNIREAMYGNDSSVGTDQMHKFYKNELKRCDSNIEAYKQAIIKLKKK